jgi:hypothetical protein
MTWTADDRQLAGLCDGSGWPAKPKDHYFTNRLYAVDGGPENAAFAELQDFPDMSLWDVVKPNAEASPYYGFNLLAVDGIIYQYLSTTEGAKYHEIYDNELCEMFPMPFHAAKLIYSPNNGRTWHNQDGSTPVVQERLTEKSPQNMVFFEEPQLAFSTLSFLQMGKAYQDNRDGYVYVYSSNGVTSGNELVMLRVQRARVRDRGAYEYFAGRRTDGAAAWTHDINARGVVHTFTRGWGGGSVVYNAPLGLYMMIASGPSDFRNGAYKGPPGFVSYQGFWVAPKPWGPWEQVYEGQSKGEDGEIGVIAPRWIAPDGRSFWAAWSAIRDARCDRDRFRDKETYRQTRYQAWLNNPYMGFNVLRVDLNVA